MKSFYLILTGLFLAVSSVQAEETAVDKSDFTLVNKQDLADRKKKWQEAVTQKAILTKENEKLTQAIEAKSDELEDMQDQLDSAHLAIKRYRELVDFVIYQQPRVWRSSTGKTLQAILIEDDRLTIRLKTGAESEVSISRNGLSKRDTQLLDLLAAVEDSAGSLEDLEPSEEHVEEQRLERIVAVVAESDLVAAESFGIGVEDAAPHARARRAVR